MEQGNSVVKDDDVRKSSAVEKSNKLKKKIVLPTTKDLQKLENDFITQCDPSTVLLLLRRCRSFNSVTRIVQKLYELAPTHNCIVYAVCKDLAKIGVRQNMHLSIIVCIKRCLTAFCGLEYIMSCFVLMIIGYISSLLT